MSGLLHLRGVSLKIRGQSSGSRPISTDSIKPGQIRPFVFWPPALMLLAVVAASLLDFDGFLSQASAANAWVLKNFGWFFTTLPFAAVLLVACAFASPLGRMRIGGADAKPVLSRWNWFAITLCTTIATGILFWGTAEPIFHFNGPPGFSGAEAHSPEAARFALSTLFFHWSITPYAIYTVPSLVFALAYYNLGRPYSLSGPLSLAMGTKTAERAGSLIDAVALLSLVAGVAASLGAGILALVGGLGAIAGVPDGPALRFIITSAIVATFVVSSISGLHRGIKHLSSLNVRLFIILAVFVFLAGPTLSILEMGAKSLADFTGGFIFRSLSVGVGDDATWVREWTVFNFAQWIAWAPITALFLGRIAVGYTVREFITFNLLLPAAFSIVWMTIFGGTALFFDMTSGQLTAALNADGPEAIIYAVLGLLPFTAFVAAGFLFVVFISFVTAMDSNTHSIASICLKAARQEEEAKGAGIWIKIFWGALIGAVAWIMTATNGVAGVKMLSNLGGLPALFILAGSMAALLMLIIKPQLLPATAAPQHEAR